MRNQRVATNRGPAGPADGSGHLSAALAAGRAFRAAVAELGRSAGREQRVMKALIVSFAAVLLMASVALAESLEPEEVVRALVRAAHNNNLQGVLDTADLVKIAAFPRHGRSPKELVGFLKGIDPKKITFQVQTRRGWPESTLVRMTAPVMMDFELRLVRASIEKQEDHYVVVAVHP